MNNLITKKEEQEAVDTISKKLIPVATEAFNRACRQQRVLHLSEINEQEVRKNLKKKGRMKHNPNARNPSGYDIVRYEAKVNHGEFPIIFDINKSPGMLYVEWHHQFEDYSEGSKRIAIRSNLREGKFDSVIRSVIKEAAESDMRLTRKEEKAGYDYLIKVIVPKAINDLYMKFLRKHPREYANDRKYPRITAADVVKNMKKQRIDVYSATYESVINDHVYFEFFLKKGEVDVEPIYPGEQARKENRLLIGATGPINTEWMFYNVETV